MMSKLFHFQLPNFFIKLEYCKNQKSSLGETEGIFYNFLKALFWRNVKEYEIQALNMNKDGK